jgi:putative DNA primase/helicase
VPRDGGPGEAGPRGGQKQANKAVPCGAALNRLAQGRWLIQETGFDAPLSVIEAVAEYRQEADVIGAFLTEFTTESESGRLSTSALYSRYTAWAKDNGCRPLSNRSFVVDLRRRYEVRRDGRYCNVVAEKNLKKLDTSIRQV